MKKRILLSLIAVVCAAVLLCALPVTAEETGGTCGDNLTWVLEDGVLTISGTGPMDSYNAQKSPPWEAYDRVITKLVIDEGVTSIGSNAFSQFEKITELNLPNSITKIGSMAFKDCYSLKEVVIPDGVVEIWDCAFDSCVSLEKITFGKSLDIFPMMAFIGCEKLNEVYFTGDLPSVMYAFDGVTANAYYPAGNETWTEEALNADYGGTLIWHAWTPICVEGHTVEILEGRDATCTKDGLTEGSHCSACGEVWTEQETIPATGHEFVDGVCAVCGQPVPALGDVNGDGVVDIFDANLVAACYNEVIELAQWQRTVADVNGDGEVDIFDANLIAAFYNELIDQFPA